MNYSIIYENLINKCVTRNWSKKSAPCYTEKHHIKPKCLGGDNSANNLVCLTAKEHYIAHLLLAKIHGGKLWYPVKLMSGNSNHLFTGSMYEVARIKSAKIVANANKGKVRTKEQRETISRNHARPQLGKHHTQETKLNMSIAQRGDKNHNFGKKASNETRLKMSISRKGCRHTDESIRKMKHKALKGVSHPRFVGYYHTPNGTFESLQSAANSIGCSKNGIRTKCENPKFIE